MVHDAGCYYIVMGIVGIDEVGRGCWAGPLVAGAVILAEPIEGLKDSKKLSQKQRERLSEIILRQAAWFGLGWVQPAEIDYLGLTKAVQLAMQRSIQQLAVNYEEIIIDGNVNFLAKVARSRAIIKADDSVPSVSAASIIAKVARDRYMVKIAEKFKNYGFEKHVGYGTALHLEKLQLYGVSELHRRSFKPIKTLLQYSS